MASNPITLRINARLIRTIIEDKISRSNNIIYLVVLPVLIGQNCYKFFHIVIFSSDFRRCVDKQCTDGPRTDKP